MQGYRNTILILAGIGTSAWLGLAGIESGADLVGLATLIGAKDAAVAASIFGRAYNEGRERSKVMNIGRLVS